jgi:hypothetical protein
MVTRRWRTGRPTSFWAGDVATKAFTARADPGDRQRVGVGFCAGCRSSRSTATIRARSPSSTGSHAPSPPTTWPRLGAKERCLNDRGAPDPHVPADLGPFIPAVAVGFEPCFSPSRSARHEEKARNHADLGSQGSPYWALDLRRMWAKCGHARPLGASRAAGGARRIGGPRFGDEAPCRGPGKG